MNYRTGIFFVLASGVLWSFHGTIIRQLDGAEAWTVLFWRSLAMLPVLWVLVSYRSHGAPMKALRASGWIGFLGGLGLVAAMGGAIVAFQTTTVANAAFLLAAAPFLAAIIGRLILKEAVSSQTKIAIALAMFGIFVMVKDGLSSGALVGNVAGLIAALGFAFFSVTLRWSKAEDSLPVTFIGAGLAVLISGIFAVLTDQGLAISYSDLAWCVLMGTVTLSGGKLLYTLGSRTVPSAELTLLSNTEVLLAPIWVWLILGEVASFGTILGGSIVLVAIAYSALSRVRRKLPPIAATPV